jgi:septal ring factor EnvC (AmiA/AmiB activator)
MTELQYESESGLLPARNESKKEARSIRNWRAWAAPVGICVVLALGSFAIGHYYIGGIQQQLKQIEVNAADLNQNVKEMQSQLSQQKETAQLLQQQFHAVENELAAVKEEMSLAGDSLNATDETKKALSQRITDLSKELEGLRKLITKLEAAARVY